MQAQVKAWGTSQGIRIPKEVLQEAAVSVDDVLDVKVSNGMIVLVKTFRHTLSGAKIRHFSLCVVVIRGQVLYTPIIQGEEEINYWISKKQEDF